MTASPPRTLFEKIWDAHLVKAPSADTPGILYIDLHLVHEVTSPQAFDGLRLADRPVPVRVPRAPPVPVMLRTHDWNLDAQPSDDPSPCFGFEPRRRGLEPPSRSKLLAPACSSRPRSTGGK